MLYVAMIRVNYHCKPVENKIGERIIFGSEIDIIVAGFVLF